jgi:hypothetical protein
MMQSAATRRGWGLRNLMRAVGSWLNAVEALVDPESEYARLSAIEGVLLWISWREYTSSYARLRPSPP